MRLFFHTKIFEEWLVCQLFYDHTSLETQRSHYYTIPLNDTFLLFCRTFIIHPTYTCILTSSISIVIEIYWIDYRHKLTSLSFRVIDKVWHLKHAYSLFV